jgi:uncharacterized protein YcfL
MKHLKIVRVLLTAFLFVSCTPSQRLKSENGLVEGTIYSIRNEPFTQLGLQTSDGTMYILKCTKEVEQFLNTKQGKKVNVHYEKTVPSPEGRMLVVTNIE